MDKSKLFLKGVWEGDLETIKSLVEMKSVDINCIEDLHRSVQLPFLYILGRQSALHFAAIAGHSAIVEYLLLKGANVEITDDSSRTPLLAALKWHNIEIAKILIRHGAKTDFMSKNGRSIISYFKQSTVEFVSFISEQGLDINHYDDCGNTLLMEACRSARKDCIAFLLERGADYRKYSIWYGSSPLHFMIRHDNWYKRSVSLIKLLLEHIEIIEGEEGMLDYVDYNGAADGQTALHLACIKRNHRAAKLLLHCGANPELRDKSGKVPYDYLSARYPDYYDRPTRLTRSAFDEMQ